MKKLCAIGLVVLAVAVSGYAADDLMVTVYNSNLGVISETRTLDFEKGISRLEFKDVPARIDPNSVTFEIAGQGKNAILLEQNYAFDLVNPSCHVSHCSVLSPRMSSYAT